MSVAFGDFDGASSIALTGAYRLSPNLVGGAARRAQSAATTPTAGLPARAWCTRRFRNGAYRPFFTLGTGVLQISPRASLVSTEDRTDQYGQVGIGLRAYLTKRFMFRAEYTGYVAFTSRDENEEVEEWKAGFAFFF